MSPTLATISNKIRKNQDLSKSLDKLEKQLVNDLKASGRGGVKLAGTETIFYMRAGNEARLFFKYSDKKGVIEKLAESDKNKESEVIRRFKEKHK